jgi:hypothetical protein
LIKGCAALMAGSFPTGAFGTYVSAIFTDSAIVIGADSRGIDVDGHTIKTNDVCKISLLNDTTAFATMGAAEFTPDARRPLINMYELAKEAAIQHGDNIDGIAISFADRAVANLNVAVRQAQRPSSDSPNGRSAAGKRRGVFEPLAPDET